MENVLIADDCPDWIKSEDRVMACSARCSLFKKCSSRIGFDCKKLGGSEIPKIQDKRRVIMLEGTVQISIKDFEQLRQKAKLYDELERKLRHSTDVIDIEVSPDEWQRTITVNAKKVANIAADHADVEERYEEDIIKLTNLVKIMPQSLSNYHHDLLKAGYPLKTVLEFSDDEAEGELDAVGLI